MTRVHSYLNTIYKLSVNLTFDTLVGCFQVPRDISWTWLHVPQSRVHNADVTLHVTGTPEVHKSQYILLAAKVA